jgi:hypothetical protein
MHIQRFFIATAILASTLLLSLAASATDQAWPPATICQAQLDSVVRYHPYGEVANWTGDTAYIVCSVGQDQALDTNDDVLIYYGDQNPTSSQNIGCYSNELADDYSTIISNGAKYSCSTVGGCTSSSSSFQGDGYIRLLDIQHGGSYFTAVNCWIPPFSSDPSTITAITLDEQ